jgi:Tfp pilus assembly protein PilE
MKDAGFNLIELCVCMTIAIILSGSGYYAYQTHQHNLAQKQAELYLHDIALSLEEHQDPKNGYANLSLTALGFSANKDDYTYTLTVSAAAFLIQAQPAFKDRCGVLSLDQKGLFSSATGSAC